MAKQQNPSEPRKKTTSFSVVMALAMLFLAVFMIFSAVSQFRSGRTISGCVSVLGAILFLGLTGLQIMALIRQHSDKKKHNQEDLHG